MSLPKSKVRSLILRVIQGVLIFLFCTSLTAQQNKILGLSMVKPNSIVLRWAPLSPAVWQTGVKYGYVIQRYTISRDGEFVKDGLSKGQNLTPQPLLPCSQSCFDSLSIMDERAGFVGEVIYGTSPVNVADFPGFLSGYEENEMKLGFALFMCDMSADIAEAAGLRFEDTKIFKGERYAYTISLVNVPDGLEVSPAIVVADAGIITELPKVRDIQPIFLDRTVKFRWPVLRYKEIYSAYILEKSSDGKSFLPVSDLPIVNLSEKEEPEFFTYTDSLESNGKQFWYRIRGSSPFGITGPPSEVISGKGSPEFDTYASIDTAIINQKSVTIRWRLSGKDLSHITGINILRAPDYNGPYSQVNQKALSVNTGSFTDSKPINSNYYQVELDGEGEMKSYSFPYLVCIEDSEPPSKPELLSGKIDPTGIVTLICRANPESDLLGYKLFKANSASGEFIPLKYGVLTGNIFKDTVTLNTLSVKVFYQLVAVDKNYNSSEYSDPIELSRPDTIPPSPGIITRLVSGQGSIELKFEKSPSTDVSAYTLYRNSADGTKVFLLGERLPDTYNDRLTGTTGIIYYSLVTKDFSGNTSEFNRSVFQQQSSENHIELAGTQSPDGKSVQLKWSKFPGYEMLKTVVYRKKDQEPFGIYETFEGEVQSFTDIKTEIGSDYEYRVLVFCKDYSGAISSGTLGFSGKKRNSASR